MKKLLIGFIFLASMSSFAQGSYSESCILKMAHNGNRGMESEYFDANYGDNLNKVEKFNDSTYIIKNEQTKISGKYIDSIEVKSISKKRGDIKLAIKDLEDIDGFFFVGCTSQELLKNLD